VPTPFIHSYFLGDIYIVASATGSIRQTTALAFKNRTTVEPADVRISVTRIPAVSFVWTGAVITVTANLPPILLARDRSQQIKQSGVTHRKKHFT
jgi:hypothetical protein